MPSPPPAEPALPSCAPFKCVRRVALLHVDRLVVRRERGLLDCFAERRMAVTRSRYVLARGAVFHRQNTLRCYVSGGERGGEEEEGRRGGGGEGRRGEGRRGGGEGRGRGGGGRGGGEEGRGGGGEEGRRGGGEEGRRGGGEEGRRGGGEEGRRGGGEEGEEGRRGREVREREERKQWRSRHYFEFFPPQNRRNVPISSPAFGPMMCAPRILSVSACAMNFTTPSASSEARARLLAMNANFPVL